MSGSVVFTTVGRDEMVEILRARISYFKLGEGGFLLSGETTEVIDASAAGGVKSYPWTISGDDFSIIVVDLGSNYFQIAGEHASFFPDYARIKVEGSTSNDGIYTIAVGGATEVGGNTRLVVEETIPSAAADGELYVDHRPVAAGPTSDAMHFPLVVEEVTPAFVVVQSLTDTTGTGALTGDGSGTINYKSGELTAEFTSNVLAGNIVRVRFKYRDRAKSAAGGLAYTDLESSKEHAVTGVDQGSKEFYVAGLFAASFAGVPKIKIDGSTGNDGLYTFVAATEVGGNTYIEVSEPIPDATVDGTLSGVAADGNPEFYTFTKLFGADADNYIEFRGTGYGTIRCHIKLQLVEGIDDGRALTYGGTPFYFEGGVFDDNDVLIAYFTFDKERKTGSVEIEHTVDMVI